MKIGSRHVSLDKLVAAGFRKFRMFSFPADLLVLFQDKLERISAYS